MVQRLTNGYITHLAFILAIFGVLVIHGTASAKSGCCSWHGGVNYCGTNGYYICNDGSQSPSCTCSGGGTTGGSNNYTPIYTTPPKCPTGQNYDYNNNKCSCPAGMQPDKNQKCMCKTGYALSVEGSYCFKLPAHAVSKPTAKDGWDCETAYFRQGNSCFKKVSSSSSSSSIAKKKMNTKSSSSKSGVRKAK